ncbi:MAG: UbiA family prenyltransferase, partial [Desulfobacterales bacterium]
TLFSLGIGFDQTYMLPGVHENILQRWITFSIPFSSYGVTPGMKIETFIVMISVFGYVFVKNSSIIKSIIFSFIVYSAVFFWGCMPFAIKGFVEFFNIEYVLTPTLMVHFTLLLILLFGTITYHIYNKKYFFSILKDMNPFRVLHYLFIFVIGISIGLYAKNGSFVLTSSNIFQFIFAPAAIVFAGIFALVINGLADRKIDKISNPHRSLIDGCITVSHFTYIGIVSFFVALLYSVVLDHVTWFVIMLIMGNYFIYSAPPLRLKRVPVFSKFFISLNSLLLLMLGYYYITYTTNVHYIIVLAFLGGFTIIINFIDLKDYEKDKMEGIKTIPTLVGLKNAKILFGAFFLIAFTSFGLFFENIILLVIMTILGIIELYLIIREPYQEKYVFGTYIFTLLIVLIFILGQDVYIPIA